MLATGWLHKLQPHQHNSGCVLNLQSSSCMKAARKQCCGWSVAVAVFSKALCTNFAIDCRLGLQRTCCTYTCWLSCLDCGCLNESMFRTHPVAVRVCMCVCVGAGVGPTERSLTALRHAASPSCTSTAAAHLQEASAQVGGHGRAVSWPSDCYTPLRGLTTATVPALHPTPTQQTHNGHPERRLLNVDRE